MNYKRGLLMQEAEAGSTGGASAATSQPSAPAAAQQAPAATSAPELDASGPSASDVELFNEPEEGDGPAVTSAPAITSAPAVTEAPTTAPVVTAAPQVTGEPQVTAAPTVTAAPAVTAKPAEVVAETPEAKVAREAAEKLEGEKFFQGLVKHYELPEDLAVKLATEPEAVLPYMAAKVHETVVKSVQQLMARELPHYIAMQQQVQAGEAKAKGAFYAAWPQLAGHESKVLETGRLFRQLNPNATAEEAIKAIGGIVTQSLGISVAGTPAVTAAPTLLPTPAGGGTGGTARPAATGKNEFTEMSMEQD